MTSGRKLLAWSDSATLATGFGKISNFVLQSLNRDFGAEIDQIGINYFGDFYDQNVFPWRIHPAIAKDSRDPIGKSLFLSSVRSGDYQFVWMQVDIQHFFAVAEKLNAIKEELKNSGKRVPKIVYYLPVDADYHPVPKTGFEVCDVIVSYTHYGRTQIVKIHPEMEPRVRVIECGYDPNSLVRLSKETRRLYRKSHFGIENDNEFLVININRNSPRKMLTHVLKVFSDFKLRASDSKLYLHTDPTDRASGINLLTAAHVVGLTVGKDVLFPEEFDVTRPKSEATMTAIYNSADCFFTCAFGEGWGLTHTDAMAIGVPVVAPGNTVFPEHLGNGERGYLYPCRESFWFDGIGYRPVARQEDALKALTEAHADFTELRSRGSSSKLESKIKLAREWMDERTWEKICSSWVELFESLL